MHMHQSEKITSTQCNINALNEAMAIFSTVEVSTEGSQFDKMYQGCAEDSELSVTLVTCVARQRVSEFVKVHEQTVILQHVAQLLYQPFEFGFQ